MTRAAPWTTDVVKRLRQEDIYDVSHRLRDVSGHIPLVLDACCGVGGATRGYQLAGFMVHGVDTRYRRDYCGNEFHQCDAVEYIKRYGRTYDFIHASPPCQPHSTLTKGTNKGREYVDIVDTVRDALESTGRPYAIENVVGSKLRPDLILCGEMFGLDVIRHRKIEFDGWTRNHVPEIAEPVHRGLVEGYRHGEYHEGPYVAVYGDGGGKGSLKRWQEAMEIDWTFTRGDIAQAIPPKYTRYIGYHVARALITHETYLGGEGEMRWG